MMDSKVEEGTLLQFARFQTAVDEGFWHRLSSLKLNKFRLDESPIPITGFYAPCSRKEVSSRLTLLADSLPGEDQTQSSTKPTVSNEGNRNRCPVPGILYNMNTFEGFKALDRTRLLETEAKKIWDDIHNCKVEESSSVLLRFVVISFADLKKWIFHYWFAFPALMLDPAARIVSLRPASQCLSLEQAKSLSAACKEWRNTSSTTGLPFFLVCIALDSNVTVRHLADWEACVRDGQKVLFGFYDPCNVPSPGWPLRNLLAYICIRWGLEKVDFFCYRETRGFTDLEFSLFGESSISVSPEWKARDCMPKVIGWDKPNKISLAKTMDPTSLAITSADLNLRLMKWRAVPDLDLDILSTTRCLLLGAGTLGCEVARLLMAWGFRKITMLDSGKVDISNPLMESLYTIDDCGEFKAIAAVRSLRHIFPAVEAEGIVMSIPMPGHPVPEHEEQSVLDDCKRLHDLVEHHDVIFLLTDTRESRWLPTLFCSSANKIAITAALGFKRFVVMHHGAGPLRPVKDSRDSNSLSAEMQKTSLTNKTGKQRLGCWFCNDVVAPVDSTANKQCIVALPGLASIASGYAVRLLAGILQDQQQQQPSLGILQDRLRIFADAEFADSANNPSSENCLGILPHQIRGSLSRMSVTTLVGRASSSCKGCSSSVVLEYQKRGLDFVLEAINDPLCLEGLTGPAELQSLATSSGVDWDDEDVPDLNLNILATTRCLLLGAGTLGCEVARLLMAWGCRKITMLDSGKVAISNPLRQSLYTIDDCGEYKAIAAVRSLRRICPAVEAEGIVMSIPMPGHPEHEEQIALDDCKQLQHLAAHHDVIFLLTDTRESRWLPTLFCSSANKIAITAALGFESFVAMRHGAGPLSSVNDSRDLNSLSAEMQNLSLTNQIGKQRLGCYFCNDVVAPANSTANRTLDQQCTVALPGLASIASGYAVILLAGILQDRLRIFADAEYADSANNPSSENCLGILPHQLRGSLSQMSVITLVGHASSSCTGCSSNVVLEYQKRGLDFVLEAINNPLYLEGLTGLTELKNSAASFDVDWDDEDDWMDA